MNNSKEIYELIKMFESDAVKFFNVTSDFTKEDKSFWNKRIYYTNGEVNNTFIAYMFGYSFGKTA